MKQNPKTALYLNTSTTVVTEVINLFLGLSWAFENRARVLSGSKESDKRRMYHLPLNTLFDLKVFDLSGAGEVKSSAFLLCTHFLQRIAIEIANPESLLQAHVSVLSPELLHCISSTHFSDENPLVVSTLIKLPAFYTLQTAAHVKYWQITKNIYEHRACMAYMNKEDFIFTLAKIIYHEHSHLQSLSLKSGMGLITTY